MIGIATYVGIENDIPSTELVAIFIELIPTIFPSKLMSAPPLLPGLIAVSVCKTVISQSSTLSLFKSTAMTRSCPETIPDVADPSGLPIAITV